MKSIPFLVVALLLVLAMPGYGSPIVPAHLWLLLGTAAVILMWHLVLAVEKNWARIDTVFLIGYCIVNFQWPLMVLLSDSHPQNWRFDALIDKHMMFGTWLATLLLLAWVAGYWLPVRLRRVAPKALRRKTKLTLLTAVVFVAFIVLAGRDYMSGKIYKESIAGVGLSGSITGLAGYIYTIYQVLILVLIAWLIYDAHHATSSGVSIRKELMSRRNFFALLVAGASGVFFIAAGERGQVIQVLCAIGLGVGSAIRPVSLRLFSLAALVGAAALTYLRFWRANAAYSFADAVQNFGVWSYTDNLAGSLYATYVGMEVVEAHGHVFFGALWLSNILGIIPFAQWATLALTGADIIDISGPAAITTYAYGSNASSGLGTTLVGDLYMNIGAFLSFPVMLAYGVICRHFQTSLAGEYGVRRFVAAVCFASLSLYMARAPLFAQLQPVVWGTLAALAFAKVRIGSTTSL